MRLINAEKRGVFKEKSENRKMTSFSDGRGEIRENIILLNKEKRG